MGTRFQGKVTSKDGTPIAYDRVGEGPPVILVDGALCSRTLGPSVTLAPELANDFSVFTYDRRGRGGSGDSARYEIDRELEDLDALVQEAGGRAFAFGHSSGAVLALRAAAYGVRLEKLALFEAPLILDATRPPTDAAWTEIDVAIAEDRRADALRAFLKTVGVPGPVIALMRWLPVWKKILALAHTLPYDGALVRNLQRGLPLKAADWSALQAPTLAIAGGKSPAFMHDAAKALASTLPRAKYQHLPGQNHNVSAKALAPVLREFLRA